MAKVERNDPCPCGSGRKFKKCCGQSKASELGTRISPSQTPSLSEGVQRLSSSFFQQKTSPTKKEDDTLTS